MGQAFERRKDQNPDPRMTTPTPRTDAIWKASIDDTGCVTRMEPIWNGLEAMEREIIEQRKRIEELETLLRPIDQEKEWWAVYAQKL